jgi:hypothetical protein
MKQLDSVKFVKNHWTLTLKEYPKFRRRWHTFQDLYHKATPQRELVNLFRENCLEKKVAD